MAVDETSSRFFLNSANAISAFDFFASPISSLFFSFAFSIVTNSSKNIADKLALGETVGLNTA